MSDLSKPDVLRKIEDAGDYARYYGHLFHCRNCGQRQHAYVQRGIPLKSVGANCDNCSVWNGFRSAYG